MKKRTLCIFAAAFVAWNGIYSPVHADNDNVFQNEAETIDSDNNNVSQDDVETHDSDTDNVPHDEARTPDSNNDNVSHDETGTPDSDTDNVSHDEAGTPDSGNASQGEAETHDSGNGNASQGEAETHDSGNGNVFHSEVETIDSDNNSTDSTVSIRYDVPKPSDRYRVEIEWGEMEFCYHPAEKVWDTIELKWKQPTESSKGTWTTKSGKEFPDGIPKIQVQLKNYSSNAIQTHFYSDDKEFTTKMVTLDNGMNLQLKSGSPIVNKAKENMDENKSGEPTVENYVIALGGEPPVEPLDPDEALTTIPVTCTITPAE